ncbi:hypothetical protein KS4_32730 [Poriferisphaera corsica]|uniref:Lipoprotein n=1 Tax=Poriferisphaera corsica TaxID=2528020 RepID=A0A517YY85_9BACT|nr:hypothetical protein [Poriferisphaera corsica]QDU35193.1 hypothetical protein KS4_32730 [Poriferisphaera corsica]
MKCLLILVLCLGMAACGGNGNENTTESTAEASKPKKITFTVKNKTGAKIIDVGINSSDSRMTHMSYGSIEKSSTETLKNKYLPRTIGLHWSKMNKDRTSANLRIGEALGPNYQGPVTLTIQPNGSVSISK